jgi:hypothetical protein
MATSPRRSRKASTVGELHQQEHLQRQARRQVRSVRVRASQDRIKESRSRFAAFLLSPSHRGMDGSALLKVRRLSQSNPPCPQSQSQPILTSAASGYISQPRRSAGETVCGRRQAYDFCPLLRLLRVPRPILPVRPPIRGDAFSYSFQSRCRHARGHHGRPYSELYRSPRRSRTTRMLNTAKHPQEANFD